MRYQVDGRTEIDWSVDVEADSVLEAEQKAIQFWEHNTISEDVEVQYVYNKTTGEPE